MKKQKLLSAFIVIAVLFLYSELLSVDAQAAKKPRQKASCSITSYQDQKVSGNITAKYKYQLPQLKGSSKAVRRINSALKKGYSASLKTKKNLWRNAELGKETSYKDTYFTETSCKVTYNKRGLISFRFHHQGYGGGTYNGWTDGMTFNLKTGRKLNVSDVMEGSKNTIKQTIINKYLYEFPEAAYDSYAQEEIYRTKISRFQFYLQNGKVIVCFGPYQPGGGNGESRLKFRGNY